MDGRLGAVYGGCGADFDWQGGVLALGHVNVGKFGVNVVSSELMISVVNATDAFKGKNGLFICCDSFLSLGLTVCVV